MKLLWLNTSEAHTNNQAYKRYSNMKYARHKCKQIDMNDMTIRMMLCTTQM